MALTEESTQKTHLELPVRVLQDTDQDDAPMWYYDVKPVVASGTSGTSTGIREGRKWYAVRKGREVGIFNT